MNRAAAIVGALALAVSSSLQAQVVIDQQQSVATHQDGPSDRWQLQLIFPALTNSVGAGVALGYFGGGPPQTGTLEIQLWDHRPDLGGASTLTSGTTLVTLGNGFTGWFDVFWSEVAVTPADDYWLAVHTFASPNFHVLLGPGNYAGSSDYRRNCSSGGSVTSAYCDVAPPYDLAFRTYAAVEDPVTVTPEPVTMTLLGTGLAGVVAARRRKRASAV